MKYLQFLVVLLLSSTLMLGCAENKSEPGENEIAEKEVPAEEINTNQSTIKAPNFALQSVDGKKIKLSDYEGKIVLVDFWATWCGPCRRGIPDLVELQNQYKDDLVVIGISLDQEATLEDVKPFMKEFKINYPIVYGTQQVVVDYGNIQAIPTSFVIDQNGNVVNKHVGLVPKSVYEQQIKTLLKKS
jgi:thiol-disulfide isomerase/thioredoxin